MNSLIQLKGQLTPRSNPSCGGGTNLASKTEVKVEHLENIIKNLEELKKILERQNNINWGNFD